MDLLGEGREPFDVVGRIDVAIRLAAAQGERGDVITRATEFSGSSRRMCRASA